MLTDEEILRIADQRLSDHGLKHEGWTLEIQDECNNRYGYTDFESKTIVLYRESWPTADRNIKEVILHEIAHALCGHGAHNLEWWDKLIDIGGRGIWVENEDKIKSIGVSVIY